MKTGIRSKTAFKNWAVKQYGSKWYNNTQLIETYTHKQLLDIAGIKQKPELSQSELLTKTFTRSDVCYDKVNARSLVEYNGICNNTASRSGRTDAEIKEHCMQGQYAEQYLIDTGLFEDCHLKYHDLVDNNGLITEVKAYSSSGNLNDIADKIRNKKWNKSKRLVTFLVEDDDYYLFEDTIL